MTQHLNRKYLKWRIYDTTIQVSSIRVAAPVSVRYAYAAFPVMDLFNKEGLPASPFTATLAPSQKER